MTAATRETHVFPDIQALSAAAAKKIVTLASDAVASRGRFTLALAGGNTPKRTYELLATRHHDAIDWARTIILFGDERFVPADDPRSNYKMARETLIDRVPIPATNVFPVPTAASSPAEAAERYEALLRSTLDGDQNTVDVALLGVGADGHTASLFPDAPELRERTRWVAPVAAPTHIEPGVPRITTTLAFLDRARTVVFLVAGADKRRVVGEILGDTPAGRRYPAAMVAPTGTALWMIDRSALPDDRFNA